MTPANFRISRMVSSMATTGAAGLVVLAALGCTGSLVTTPTPGGGSLGGGPGAGGSVGPGPAGSTGNSGTGGGPGAGGSTVTGVGGTGGPVTGTGGSAGPTTVTCPQAARPYAVASVALSPSLAPHINSQGFGATLFAQVPVAVHPTTGAAYVGFTRDVGGVLTATIVPATAGASTPAVAIPAASLGGLAVSPSGFGALVFDPNDNVDARTWAAVQRFDAAGTQLFATDLFRSANLTAEGTKGAPGTSRFAYLPGTDQLVAYFGHTEMIQGTRHQGGYLATLNLAGAQTVVSDWWGSHNLDQRMLVAGSQLGLLGLGDAFPKGVFFSFLVSRPSTRVVMTLAGNGQGNTNGQLGGMVDLDDALVLPFITNTSISQTLTPGDWPNIDQTIAAQITAAANNGNKLGLLLVPKAGTIPAGDLAPIWIEPSLAAGARLERLKAVRYGADALVLLAWAEATGTGRTVARSYFTMVVDRSGAVCQAKTALPAANAFTAGDDLVRRPDGSIVWGSVTGTQISVVTLTPG